MVGERGEDRKEEDERGSRGKEVREGRRRGRKGGVGGREGGEHGRHAPWPGGSAGPWPQLLPTSPARSAQPCIKQHPAQVAAIYSALGLFLTGVRRGPTHKGQFPWLFVSVEENTWRKWKRKKQLIKGRHWVEVIIARNHSVYHFKAPT